jgi:hypothetical protein
LKQALAAPLIVDGVDAEKAAVNPRRPALEECVRRQAHHHDEEYNCNAGGIEPTSVHKITKNNSKTYNK